MCAFSVHFPANAPLMTPDIPLTPPSALPLHPRLSTPSRPVFPSTPLTTHLPPTSSPPQPPSTTPPPHPPPPASTSALQTIGPPSRRRRRRRPRRPTAPRARRTGKHSGPLMAGKTSTSMAAASGSIASTTPSRTARWTSSLWTMGFSRRESTIRRVVRRAPPSGSRARRSC